MEKWEADRILEKGDGPAFWTLIPDFEHHFEALRGLAGPPAAGTIGRVLPKYQPSWGDEFWDLITYRINWWNNEAAKAIGRDKKSD